jgi:hypothetical protein
VEMVGRLDAGNQSREPAGLRVNGALELCLNRACFHGVTGSLKTGRIKLRS